MSKKTRAITDPRAAAAATLVAVLDQKGSLSTLDDTAIAPRDRSFYRALCFGVCRALPQLELLAAELVSKGFKRKDLDIQALLLIGLYQLMYMRVPGHAAVGETAGAAKLLGKPWATRVLNACLRRYQREHETLTQPLEKRAEYRYLHPKWLVQAIKADWPEQAEAILAANNTPAPMTLRVNRAHTNREDYQQHLTEAQLAATYCKDSADGITLEHPTDVASLPDFGEGDVSVQDESAQLTAPMLMDSLEKNEHTPLRILDACSAPGGKTLHLIECALAAKQPLHITALDSDAHRLERVEEGIERLRPDESIEIELQCADASQKDWWDGTPFDAILLDAPCSGTGVIRRHPDIKQLRTKEDISALAHLQSALLRNVWSMLKEDGTLLYATCSIMPVENSLQIERFLTDTPDASDITPSVPWGIEVPNGRQRLPEINGSDGFFYSLLRKG